MSLKTGYNAQSGGAILALLLVFSLFSTPMLLMPVDVGAQSADVAVSSIGFGGTSIIEFKGTSDASISKIRIWLQPDVSLSSFKSQDGWTGKKNTAGVVVFTSSSPIGAGEAVKFGLKSDSEMPQINWKVLDASDNQIGIGISQPEELTAHGQAIPGGTGEGPPEGANGGAIHHYSSFRLIPDKPNVGDTIRVVGMSFEPSEALVLHIGGFSVAEFETDAGGNFVITSTVPDSLSPSRTDFVIRDRVGNEETVSLRLGEEPDRGSTDAGARLAVGSIRDTMHRGDPLEITGTASPGGTITVQVIDPDGDTITAEPRIVDGNGNWSFDTIMAHDAQFGTYKTVITDGTDTIERSWAVETSKTIIIDPTTQRFEPGDLITFSGTAVPEEPIEFVLENPHGNQVFSDTKHVDGSGYVEFTYQTDQSTPEGTYVLFAKQLDSTEIVLVGLGELPKEHLVAKLDKVNYKKSDTATINIEGPPSATLSLLIIDPSDKEKYSDNEVVLRPDGKLGYELDLDGYSSGIYTLVLSRANTKMSEVFSVGLPVGSGPIEINVTKETYQTSDPVLVLGETNPNVLITIQLIDPNGDTIKEAETFTNKEGRISDSSFRIPSDGMPGTWQVKASSGSNFAIAELEIVATVQEGIIVTVDGIENFPGTGDVVNFSIVGAQNTVEISITNQGGDEIAQLKASASQAGYITQPWPIPRDLPPGLYTITATDAFDSDSANFFLE